MSTTPAVRKDSTGKGLGSRAPFLRNMLMWMLSFLAIPIAGYIGTFIVGRIDNLVAALIGGSRGQTSIRPANSRTASSEELNPWRRRLLWMIVVLVSAPALLAIFGLIGPLRSRPDPRPGAFSQNA